MFPYIRRISLPKNRRIIAVSDIHGNLPYLRGLLEKLRFTAEDVLFVVGDFTDKGPGSLAALRFLMDLSRSHTVHTLCGNHDIWALLLDGELEPKDTDVLSYMASKPDCLAREMCREIGLPFSPDMDFGLLRSALFGSFAPEFGFLRSMPTLVETDNYVFVHGGVPADKSDGWAYLKYDRFMTSAPPQEKWTVVGHWPVMLYHEDHVDANPVFDYEKKIISIDGGCVLKDDGQLNALVIPRDGSFDFSVVSYDSFPTAVVQQAQSPSKTHWYIRWGDNRVRILRHGEEFCLCRHVRTGYEMEILTKYLYGEGPERTANDCTDYVLPLSPGDRVSVVEKTSRGYFVKHNGVSGWYFGPLEPAL